MCRERPLSVAVIGAGRIAPVHLTALISHGSVRVASIFDVERPSAERLAQTFRVPYVAHSIEEVLASDADAVDIITSPESHYLLASAALKSGKHVICEKPLCLRSSQVSALATDSQTASRLV